MDAPEPVPSPPGHIEVYNLSEVNHNSTDHIPTKTPQGTPRGTPRGTILGLRRTTFILAVALTVVTIAAAVGGGVGGSLAVSNAKKYVGHASCLLVRARLTRNCGIVD